MKIVVLDAHTLNPGDLSWEGLERLGKVFIHDRTPNEMIIERAKDASIIITNKTPITKETMSYLTNLKYIVVMATGYDIVDIHAAKEKNILVSNVPTYGTNSVAQFTFALILELCHHIQNHNNAVKNGEWAKSKEFCFWNYPLIELSGKTIGIVGFGKIGQRTAYIAQAFGMKVIVYDKSKRDEFKKHNIEWKEINALLKESDFVSLHCPLTCETQGIINKVSLNMMKNTAYLINTSRGGLIVDKDLAEALANGKIAGAAVDVLSAEPPTKNHILVEASNCIVTPHIAWATKDARNRLINTVIENVEKFIEGKYQNIVNY